MIPTTTREQALEDIARQLWGLLDSIARTVSDEAKYQTRAEWRERLEGIAQFRLNHGELDANGHLNLKGVPVATPFVAEQAAVQAMAKGLGRLESENQALMLEKAMLTELLYTTTRRLVEPLLHPPAPPLPPLEDTCPLAEHAAPDQARAARAEQQHQPAGVGPEDSVRGPAH